MRDYQKYITQTHDTLVGKPRIKGTRISVELIVRKLGGGYSIEALLESYPHLTKPQILAALQYAADVVGNELLLEPA
jgi:uncharacterized protein (DUF433 family)